MLDGPLACIRLAHELFDRPTAVAVLLSEQLRNCLGVCLTPTEDASPGWQSPALFLQHLPFPPRLDWQLCGVTAGTCQTLRRLIALITAVRIREARVLTSRKSNAEDQSEQPERPVRAAEYVRMSTDHQKYSTENQADAIKQYAEARRIDIVRTYADEGKSGLSVDGRDAFKRLIADVSEGRADFEMILVYDVSRWGRFQDADKAPTTNTSASAPAFAFNTVRSNSKMMEARSLPLSKA